MPPSRKRTKATASSPARATKKEKVAHPPPAPVNSHSDSDSDLDARPPPKKKSKPAPKAKASAASKKKDPASTSTSSTAKGKGKAKGKAKAKEVIVLSSDDEQDDNDDDDDGSGLSDVIVEKKKPVPAAKKGSKSAKPSKAKANSPPTPAEHSPVPSTSASVSHKVKAKKPVKPLPPKPVTFEDAHRAWFSHFVEEDGKGQGQEDQGDDLVMDGAGIEKLFDEMGLTMEGVEPFLLAWKVGAQPGTFGSFNYQDFAFALKPHDIRTTPALAALLASIKSSLYSDSDELDPTGTKPPFALFYQFLFPFLKEDGQKSLSPQVAIAVLDLVLAPKYELAQQFVAFATAQGEKFKSVSLDVWTQLYEFVDQVGPDLNGWSEMDAWPSTIDQFVEWKQAQDAAK